MTTCSINSSMIELNDGQLRNIIPHVVVLSDVLRSKDLSVDNNSMVDLDSAIVDRLKTYMRKKEGSLDGIKNTKAAFKYIIKKYIGDENLQNVALERCKTRFRNNICVPEKEEDPIVKEFEAKISLKNCKLGIIQISDKYEWEQLIEDSLFGDEHNVIADKNDMKRKCKFVLLFQSKEITPVRNKQKIRGWVLHKLTKNKDTRKCNLLSHRNNEDDKIIAWQFPSKPIMSSKLSPDRDLITNILSMLRQKIDNGEATCLDSQKNEYKIPFNHLPGLYKSNLTLRYIADD